MSRITPTVAPLSPHWAFVVQLREGTPLTPQHIQGRVEHITSGRAMDFHSLAALLAFMEAVLTARLISSRSPVAAYAVRDQR